MPSCLALSHFPGINGPYYWKWGYHDGPLAAYLAVAISAFGIVYWALLRPDDNRGARRAVLAAVAAHLLLSFGFIGFAQDSFANIAGRVAHPDINSFHSEAQSVDDVGDWLASFEERVPGFLLHAKTHPPGSILFYVVLNRAFGAEGGAYAGGGLLGLFAALAVPLAYITVRDVTGSRTAGLTAAVLSAALPGPILMVTSFDAVYPVATLAMIWSWRQSLRSSTAVASVKPAIVCGIVLLVSMLFTHNILVLGAWFVLSTALAFFSDDGAAQQKLRKIAVAVGTGSIVVIGGLLALYALTGYDHLAALEAAIDIQDELAGQLQRPYSYTVVWDLYDFFLAGGWVTFGLLVVFAGSWRKHSTDIRTFAATALATIVIVDLSGLLAAEAARVWLFLQPFAVSLAAIELARRAILIPVVSCAVMLFALAAIRTSMNFI